MMARQLHLPLPVREAMGLEDFLPSPANKAATDWLLCRHPQAWGAPALMLWGPEGTGKTHLLRIWSGARGAVQVALGDEAALARLVQAAEPEGGANRLGGVAVDDADWVAGNRPAEEWLQHLYNAAGAAGLPLLLAARRPAVQWGLSLPDIETRLKSVPAVAIDAPDDDLMQGLLLKLFSDRQLMVDSGVVSYLAARLERTGTALAQAVQTLDAAALEGGRKISIPFVQKALGLVDEAKGAHPKRNRP